MNYLECLAYLESLSPTLEKPQLTRMLAFMAEHGDIQDAHPVIHITGTNGKGSSSAIVDSLLRSAGLRVGRFTGPHLLRWNERFHLDGSPIDDQSFARLATRIRDASESFGRRHPELGCLTWFEFLTVVAFFWFFESKVDCAVFEVGLGGRFDATNIIKSVVTSVITNVDLDHTRILGDTIKQIAYEKSGIIKPSVPVVTQAQGEALAPVMDRAKELNSTVIQCRIDKSAQIKIIDSTPDNQSKAHSHSSAEFQDLLNLFQAIEGDLALSGSYQRLNALTALTATALSGLALQSLIKPTKSIKPAGLKPSQPADRVETIARHGFQQVYWPGRLQILPERNLILDGAHNQAGARALRNALNELFPERPVCFLISCFENKDAQGMLRTLLKPADRALVTEASTRRATFDKELLLAITNELGAQSRAFASVSEAFAHAYDTIGDNELVVATGSFATVREVVTLLGWQTVEDGLKDRQTGCAKITGSIPGAKSAKQEIR